MVLEPINVSPHKQIVKDYDVKECICIKKLKIKKFQFFFKIMKYPFNLI